MGYELNETKLLILLILIIMSILKRSEIMHKFVAKYMHKFLGMLDLNIPCITEPRLLLYLRVSKHGYSNG